jgi:hypothetical protein
MILVCCELASRFFTVISSHLVGAACCPSENCAGFK